MDEHDLNYIVPLRRNNGMIDRTKLKSGNRVEFDGHFIFKERDTPKKLLEQFYKNYNYCSGTLRITLIFSEACSFMKK